ncbi:MAG TPA: toll/interleukin-1 receptor domain-containing protein, partial [Mucilaginibacter sp.]
PLQILKFEQLRSLWVSNNPLTNFPVNQIAAELHALSALYCFSPMNNSGVDSNYQQLQSKKGNGIGLLHLLALKEKPKAAISRHVAKTPGKKSLFISYSHADLEWLTKIELALQTMKYEGLAIDSWNDTRIRAGDLWKKEIENAIGKADVAILLISTSFLASKFIREEEVPPLLKKAEEQGTKILPIIVGLCRFTQSVLKSYQAVNKPEKPLNALSVYEQDKVIYDLTLEIDKVFENL